MDSKPGRSSTKVLGINARINHQLLFSPAAQRATPPPPPGVSTLTFFLMFLTTLMFFNVNVLFDVLDDVNVLFDALFPSCPAGYTPSPTGCVDVDECLSFPCEQDCTNTPGAFQCSCRPGYETSRLLVLL